MTTLPSRNFRPRVYGVGAWTDNLPFAYDLVATLRPRVVVELGVDRGESYFTFCQSAAENSTETRCFGIDTWMGDEHVGEYDETTFREVSEHNAECYARFSRLLRCNFDEALCEFAPDSIDLLHIDGRHTEAAARHDVESWLPKLAPGSILLMHDVCVQTRDFGVWKIWQELCQRSRSFTFRNGPGLGVWQKPPVHSLPEPLETLLSGSTTELAHYYGDRAATIHQQIADDWRTGAVRDNAIGKQTVVQIFYTHDQPFSEENSLLAGVGHGRWNSVSLDLPRSSRVSYLRIDFVSPFTTIEIKSVEVKAGRDVLFCARSPAEFDRIRFAGNCERVSDEELLRLRITGIDPQLHLPELRTDSANLTVCLTLRVNANTAL